MIDIELWRAKASAIAAFASGPAMMIDDEEERDRRLAFVLVAIDIEYESAESTDSAGVLRSTTLATITDIHAGEIHASNSKINWPNLVDQVRANPSKPVKLLYDRHHTAVVTTARINKRYAGLSAFTERRGDAGVVIITGE